MTESNFMKGDVKSSLELVKKKSEDKNEAYWPKRLFRQQTQGLFGQSIAGYVNKRLANDVET